MSGPAGPGAEDGGATRPPVRLTAEYAATPDRVFAAWTDVDVLSKWFGCDTDMLWSVHRWEPVAGGEIHVSLDFDGVPYEVKGRFAVVEPPHRLQYHWEGTQVVTVTIEATDAGSRMTVEQTGLPSGDMDQIVTEGWTAGMSQLGQLLR